jgi:3-deoxy-7-phosphoheptulonate synthase
MNLEFERKLTIPMETKAMYPVTAELEPLVAARAETLRRIFEGLDDRLLLVIGPCSADRPDSVLDYLTRLRRLQEQVEEKIFMVPRLYTNKPRTTGDGYKGMLHQPDPNANPDMLKGVIAIRKLHLRALEETGFSCADEMLYPENHPYLSDVLSYVAVGARSVENQQHRLVASGLDVPVGMKNPTSGDLRVMLNAISAARHEQSMILHGWVAETDGNPYTHAILRGYEDIEGNYYPNYHYEHLCKLYDLFHAFNIKNEGVIVDCNHSNSAKHYDEQIRIAEEVLHNCRQNRTIDGFVKGLMIESYLLDGAQMIGEGVYGRSITDPCLGWEKTERLILGLADRRR